jgi:hypothetical protein
LKNRVGDINLIFALFSHLRRVGGPELSETAWSEILDAMGRDIDAMKATYDAELAEIDADTTLDPEMKKAKLVALGVKLANFLQKMTS